MGRAARFVRVRWNFDVTHAEGLIEAAERSGTRPEFRLNRLQPRLRRRLGLLIASTGRTLFDLNIRWSPHYRDQGEPLIANLSAATLGSRHAREQPYCSRTAIARIPRQATRLAAVKVSKLFMAILPARSGTSPRRPRNRVHHHVADPGPRVR